MTPPVPSPYGPADGIGLVKVSIVRIEDDGLSLIEFAQEAAAVALVPALGHSCSILDRQAFLRIEVEFEVLRLEGLEVEVIVLDFVAPEVLRVGSNREKASNQQGQQKRPGPPGRKPATGARLRTMERAKYNHITCVVSFRTGG